MKIVGITGGIGSGKTTLARYFNDAFGIPVYYADAEAKALMHSPKLVKQIIALLGEQSYKDGRLDRAFVASRVFKDQKLLDKLNAIVHPAVKQHFKSWVKKQSAPYILKEAAILFENGNAADCDAVILVTAPEALRIERVIDRDGTPVEDIKDRINKQWSDAQKIPLADFVIENIQLSESKKQAEKIHSKLLGDRINT
ncbi:MAG: dephospho-CoA kinase [Leeuwenhoekiella sp.]|nr:MAG: dephospho-CoA kinase [Leeuwenhoekiella sp.]